jgi:exodeoxyribonuclease V beta subunit
MTPGAPFQLASTPLSTGVTLIEASAGTGKTSTIAGIFLRLILEHHLPVTDMLVVTFTEAATEELRDRIRQLLLAATSALATGRPAAPLLQELLAAHRPKAAELIPRLQTAITGFDQAPIFTIHGFCQRTLKDRAFESGALFDMELLVDESGLKQEVADDYWRLHFYEADPVVVAFARLHKLEPGTFLEWMGLGRHPGLRILSRLGHRTLPELEAVFLATFHAAAAVWRSEEAAIRRLLLPPSGRIWGKKDHGKATILQEALAAVQDCFNPPRLQPEALGALKFLARRKLEVHTRARASTPRHRFFDLCEEFLQAGADLLTGWRIDFLSHARTDLARRKLERKQQSFDDLLDRLHTALAGPGGALLAREVRHRYRAALIDEFQDTDPVQSGIFQRLFAPAGGVSAEEGRTPSLFFIGDPKQAIYGFRGADLFTYLDAAREAANRYTLERNWRSERRLVNAVNTLFSRSPCPFVFDDIRFQPVQAAGDADQHPLLIRGQREAPLQVWFMARNESQKHITVDRAAATLADAVAAEIVRLLHDDVTLDGRRLTPRDLAVLVPDRRRAGVMQTALRKVNVPSVLHVEESVFDSGEAAELAQVLAAIAQPAQERLLRAAQVTDLLGLSAEQLQTLTADPRKWPAIAERSYQYREIWTRQGFAVFFRAWMQGEDVRSRLLHRADGERRLTNLLHLGELLHQAAQDRQPGPSGLVRWLNEQIASTDPAPDEHQLRLERDDQAVRLVTVHKSKGLEYPVVFYPFTWLSVDLARSGEERIFCHREVSTPAGRRTEFIWDLGSEDQPAHRAMAIKELLAERLRLLYVALTRARNRCYFSWGAFNKGGSAALAWLLHPPPTVEPDLKTAMDHHFKTLGDPALRAILSALAEASRDAADGVACIAVSEPPPVTGESYRPAAPAVAELAPRQFTRRILRDWRITSFSQLTAQAEDERPDYDRASPGATAEEPLEEEAPPPDPPTGFLSFPRGTSPGTCLHKIFELLDFAQAHAPGLTDLVRYQLQAHGLAGGWTEVVCAAVRRTVATPLGLDQPDWTLGQLSRRQRLNELEFQFPVHRISPALLRAGLSDPGRPGLDQHLARLGFQPAGGFVKGFIDLVFEHAGRFYLLDWKSNWLGPRIEDYAPPSLEREMAERFYVVQYHLYAVALHLYLSRRLARYDFHDHFGGVFYLFLRGLDPARPEFGVFRDRPSRERVEQLTRLLAEGGSQ